MKRRTTPCPGLRYFFLLFDELRHVVNENTRRNQTEELLNTRQSLIVSWIIMYCRYEMLNNSTDLKCSSSYNSQTIENNRIRWYLNHTWRRIQEVEATKDLSIYWIKLSVINFIMRRDRKYEIMIRNYWCRKKYDPTNKTLSTQSNWIVLLQNEFFGDPKSNSYEFWTGLCK